MLIAKTGPVGIDWYIQQLQTYLHGKLLAAWNLSDAQYIAYGRCYRNRSDDGYIAENYQGDGNYKEVYWDDAVSAISFFGTGSTEKNGVEHTADVHLVFFANLKKLKPSITHRADEEVRRDVAGLFGLSLKGFTYESTEMWTENVLREYPGSRRDKRLIAVDMHPLHCFRLNLKLIYNPSKNC